jgi:hypothetical protein
MDGVYGSQVKAAVRRLSETQAFGDEAVDPTTLLPILSESMKSSPEFDREQAIRGSSGISDSTIVKEICGGSISTELWYTGLEYLWHAAFGFECPTVYTGNYASGSGGSPAPHAASANVQHHVFEFDDIRNITGWTSTEERAASSGSHGDATEWDANDKKIRCFDLSILKGVLSGTRCHRYRSCMVKGFTVNMGLERCTVDWDLVAQKLDYHDTGSASWAVPETDRVVLPNVNIYLEPQAANFSGDALRISEAKIKCELPLDDGFISTESAPYIEEPVGGGVRKVSGTLKLGRYTSANQTIADYVAAGTELMMKISCLGGEIGSTGYACEYMFAFPHVKLTKASFPVAGPGVITGDLEFEAIKDTAEYSRTWVTDLLGGISAPKQQEMFLLMRNGIKACISRDHQAGGVSLP